MCRVTISDLWWFKVHIQQHLGSEFACLSTDLTCCNQAEDPGRQWHTLPRQKMSPLPLFGPFRTPALPRGAVKVLTPCSLRGLLIEKALATELSTCSLLICDDCPDGPQGPPPPQTHIEYPSYCLQEPSVCWQSKLVSQWKLLLLLGYLIAYWAWLVVLPNPKITQTDKTRQCAFFLKIWQLIQFLIYVCSMVWWIVNNTH